MIKILTGDAAETPSKKLETCVKALEFIAFNNHPCWKDRDRKHRAMQTLLDIGTHVRITPNGPRPDTTDMKTKSDSTAPQLSPSPMADGDLLERLVRHISMMAPHQKDREGGRLLIESADEIKRLQTHLRAVLNLTVSDGANKIVEVTTAAEKALPEH